MKRFLLFLGGLALVFLVSIGLVASCVVRAGHSIGFGTVFREKATRVDDLPLEVAPGQRLAVDLVLGNIRVQSSAGAQGSVQATITGFGSTLEEAKAALAEAKVRIDTSNDGSRIVFVEPPRENGMFRDRGASVDLDIRLPDGVHLELKSGSGDVRAEGAFAASTLHSSYGDVRVRGVEGDLEATSSSGDVGVEDARGTSVTAESSYGDVAVRNCEAKDLEAKSRSGDVTLESVQAERLRAGSAYGNVEAKRISGELDVELASGDARIEDWKGSRASLETKYGDVQLRRAAGAVEASSSSGDIEVDGFEGQLQAKSGYGDVRVAGIFSSLVADTSSGDVEVSARAGSRIEGTWKISSSYGAAELIVPDGLGCDLDAKTAYGSVDVDIPVEVRSTQGKKSSKSLQGKVNGGGGLVEIRCRSGDVRVHSGGT